MVDKAALAQRFIEAIPHARELGLAIVSLGDGRAEMTLPYDARLVGDPKTGVLHGGAISTLIDTCCGSAVMSHEAAGTVTATIDLRIDYMRGATPGQTIRAEATCYHVTRSVAFVRAVAMDDDAERPVATASGSFTVGKAP